MILNARRWQHWAGETVGGTGTTIDADNRDLMVIVGGREDSVVPWSAEMCKQDSRNMSLASRGVRSPGRTIFTLNVVMMINASNLLLHVNSSRRSHRDRQHGPGLLDFNFLCDSTKPITKKQRIFNSELRQSNPAIVHGFDKLRNN
jgi:hypothetical protein